MAPALSFVEVTKRFPGVLANDRVTLDIDERTIHGVIGENGAGKSTLMGLAAGLHQPDSGLIRIFGQPQRITSPTIAAALGIGMVHQEFKLVPSMTVAENVILGTPEARGRLRMRSINRKIANLSAQYRLDLAPRSRIIDLPVGLRQRVEILKALHSGARILIFDEPTAVLTPQEAEELFVTFRSLRDQGRTVIFISHKLREVVGVTDRVSVMRRGRVVGEFATSETTPELLAQLMVGRRVLLHRADQRRASATEGAEETAALGASIEHLEREPAAGTSTLVVGALRVRGELGQVAVQDVSFDVRAGEILGIAGVAGNGQLELEEAIAGIRRVAGGRILLDGVDVTTASTRRRRQLGLSYIPEDRMATGTERTSSIAENMIMGGHYRPPIARGGQLRPRSIHDHTVNLITRFEIAAEGPGAPLRSLSGGNIQKVVVAREIASTPQLLGNAEPRVLVASQPTRGVDVGAIEYIHSQLLRLRESGTAILLISFELDEVFFLSDRIRVLYNGSLSGELDPSRTTERDVGLLMGGEVIPAQADVAGAGRTE
jgi:simple sugar transport system ATP-binding protein